MCRCWIWDQNGRHVQGRVCCTNGRLIQHHLYNPIKSWESLGKIRSSKSHWSTVPASFPCLKHHNFTQMIWYGTEHNPVRLPRHSQQFSGKQKHSTSILSWRENQNRHYQPLETTNIYQAPASLSPPLPSPGWQPIMILWFIIGPQHGCNCGFRSTFEQSIHYRPPNSF